MLFSVLQHTRSNKWCAETLFRKFCCIRTTVFCFNVRAPWN